MEDKKIGIIPARMASTRFPGKPLANIHGMPMLGHIYYRAKLCKDLDEVYIATCDDVILNYSNSIGAPCIMTANTHERATDRTAEALQKIENLLGYKIDIVAMIQGDEPMILPDMITQALLQFKANPTLEIVNLMTALRNEEDFEDPNEVKVVVDKQGYALYFSREPIPSRKKGVLKVPMYRQLGVIHFRRDYLRIFNELPQTPLEIIESVDMLRVLEHGGKIKMVSVDKHSHSVDTHSDLQKVIEAMENDLLFSKYLHSKTEV